MGLKFQTYFSGESIISDPKKNIVIGKSNYSRLQVPPNIWFSFKGLDSNTNLVCNLASIEHEPNEVSRIKLSDFPITL